MIKGVNLGGWFVLESWMKPELFKGLKTKDETGFVTMNPQAKKDLEKHWFTFITKEDFVYLKQIGINSVRLPIGWWFEGDDPYINSTPYIHQAMKWASEVGLDVLLDLHTAPGCQNGFDNGGIEGVMTWHLFPRNIDLTIDKLERIVLSFRDYPSFMGIEVLNEPFTSIDMNIIHDFYLRAYNRIRKHSQKLIVFHDAFRPLDPNWRPFFEKHQMENIALDLHLYHCFDPKLITGTFENHLHTIMNERIPMIQSLSKFVKIIVGEWSLGINFEKMQKDASFDEKLYTKLLADLQLYAYSQGFGYYFWSYKIERESHRNWDFRRLIQDGILPSHF
ncbi:MAG TPA: cellulase family glycosylhydrolase [Acholeplasmataceae bacterium]|nr:cellulase family glycosylhydrolase [Acholeplasmataceae bacterium]